VIHQEGLNMRVGSCTGKVIEIFFMVQKGDQRWSGQRPLAWVSSKLLPCMRRPENLCMHGILCTGICSLDFSVVRKFEYSALTYMAPTRKGASYHCPNKPIPAFYPAFVCPCFSTVAENGRNGSHLQLNSSYCCEPSAVLFIV
jgi:hypothetical protein